MASIRYIVKDVDRSADFYRNLLEFKVDKHNPGKFAALKRDDLTLYLSAPGAGSGGTAGGNPEPGGWNRLMFVTDDIDALISRLSECRRHFPGRNERGWGRSRKTAGRPVGQSRRAVRVQERISPLEFVIIYIIRT